MGNYITGNNYASNTMNSIFNSLGGSNKSYGSFGISSMASMLSDYNSIRNGSYYKLAKQYYGTNTSRVRTKTTTEEDTKTKKKDTTEETSDTTAKTDTMKAAQTAVESLDKLMKSDLYAKVEKKDEEGNKVEEYNKDAILKNVKTFVNDYNSLIKTAGESTTWSTRHAASQLAEQTKGYKHTLATIGISIGEDNLLSIDEEKFGEADMESVKELFKSGLSFGRSTQTKILQVYSTDSQAQSMTSGIYSSKTTKSASVGTMFDDLF